MNPDEQQEFYTQKFSSWLSGVLPNSTPEGVVAYYFSIVELTHGDDVVDEHRIGVIGTRKYNPDDDDWASEAEKVWWPLADQGFSIPSHVYGVKWQTVQARIFDLVARFIANSANRGAHVLRSAYCVAVGFVDGDLLQVWPEPQRPNDVT